MFGWVKQTVSRKGFTIVELLIVVVVIAILAAVTVVAYTGISQRSKDAALKSEVSQALKAVESAKVTNGTDAYPATLAAINLSSSKLTYYYNGRSNSYCLEGNDAPVVYSVTNGQTTVRDVPCTEQGVDLWMPLNGSLADQSSNGYTLTATGSPVPTTGAGGGANTAYAFDGVDDMLYIDTNTIPSKLDAFTVSVWSRGVGSPNNDYMTLVHRSLNDSIGSSVIWVGASPSQVMNISTNGQFGSGVMGITATTTDWRHTVMVYAGGYQTGYVDAVQRVDSSIGPVTNNSVTNRFSIGASRTVGYRDIVGAVDDVRVYNRALTLEEIQALYANGAR